MTINKLLCAFISTIMVLTVIISTTYSAQAVEPFVVENATSAYLYNIENKMPLVEHNIYEQIYPTSSVKIMTGLVAIEYFGAYLDQTITITDKMLENRKGNNISLVPGEIVTVRDLLHALLVGSANDAAHVLAFVVAGSIENFVDIMNKRAIEIGTINTVYRNPSGMHHKEMVTTVADTAKIALVASQNPTFMEICTTLRYTMKATNKSAQRTIHNKNHLLSRNTETKYYYVNAKGMNVGMTAEGGYCTITLAEQDGVSYLAIVMGGQEINGTIYSYTNAKNMLTWAYANYKYIEVINRTMLVCELPVLLADAVDHVTLIPSGTLDIYLPADTNLKEDITYSYTVFSPELTAPVYEGDTAGSITVFYKNELIGTLDLITKSSVERSEFLFWLAEIQEFSRSRFFRASVISVVVLSIVYVLGNAIIRDKKTKKRLRYR